CGSTARGAAFTHVAAIATAAEQNQVLGNDFSAIFLFAALLIFPTRGLQAAFNVELGTFLDVLANDFSQPLPGDNVMPFGAVLPFAAFVFVSFVGRQAELGHGNAAGRVFHLRVFAQIAHQNHFVNTLC